MTREEFLIEMQDVLQRDEKLDFEMQLQDIEEWDSLSVMATMAFLEQKFDVKTTFSDYKEMKTLKDIADKVGI